MYANRLSFFYDFHGPSMNIDTACSSALVALVQACQAIESGEIDMAIVGGSSITLHPGVSGNAIVDHLGNDLFLLQDQ